MIFDPIIPVKRGFYPYKALNSCRFNSVDSPALSRTPTVAGNRKKWTFWTGIKRGKLSTDMEIFSAGSTGNFVRFTFFASDIFQIYAEISNSQDYRIDTVPVYRDPTSHFLLMIVMDTTEAVASDRLKIFIGHEQVTALANTDYPGLNQDSYVNDTVTHYIGTAAHTGGGSLYFDGYLTEPQLVDGLALTPSDVWESKYGISVLKKYNGSYGTNGFKLDFANASNLGNDVSGNDNDFTVSNLTSDDQVPDTPTNNYCVVNEVHNYNAALSNGNLEIATTPADNRTVPGSIKIPSTGKYYWEVTIESSNNVEMPGIIDAEYVYHTNGTPGADADHYGYGYYAGNGNLYYGAGSSKTYGATFTLNDVIGVAVDMDAGTIEFYKNNVSQGSESITLDRGYLPAFGDGSASQPCGFSVNFGQLGFTYTPPSGFKTLCSENLPIPTVKNSAEGFVQTTAAGSTIAADLAALRSAWPVYIDIFKNRSVSEDWEWIFSDDPTNSIHSNTPDEKGAKQTLVGANSYWGGSLRVGQKYGVYTSEIPHTTGTDTNQAHGLNGSEFAAIAKRTSTGGGDWWMTHPGLTANYNIKLNTNDGETSTQYVDVDSTYIKIKGAAPSGTYRVIVFADGFLSLSSYDANGNVLGPYIDIFDRPAWMVMKRIDIANHWSVRDSARDAYNPASSRLQLNEPGEEYQASSQDIDILSKGIKIRNSDTETNASGGTYIVIAIPEQAGKHSTAK